MNIRPKPVDVKWTDDQWKAIVASGKNILVAAAAGSGKTAVLVERIIQKLLAEEQIDVDRLLIVTFTNAAAKEMKSRIGEAIEAELEQEPSSAYLRKQLLLLNKASISTLHSFCLDVIRKHYYLVNIDPSFRIGNETEIQLLIEEVMEELLEEEYGSEQPERFYELVDSYTSDRSDAAIQSLILKVFRDSCAQPDGDRWLDSLVELYDVEGQDVKDISYFQLVTAQVKREFQGMVERLKVAKKLAESPLAAPSRFVTLTEDLIQFEPLLKCDTWDEWAQAIKNCEFAKLGRAGKNEVQDKDLDKQIQDLRNKAKAKLQSLQDTYFGRESNQYVKDLLAVKKNVETLVELVKKFREQFRAAKREKALVDFADLELYCLQILQGHEEVASQYREKFVEVLVDEYQDTNGVQEAILRCVTSANEEQGNLFMVGDVKQAIYGFRLAEPRLFLEKYKSFTRNGEESGLRIDLNQNFRSRHQVLDATNYIFKQIMDESVGEITYDEAAELKVGNKDYTFSDSVTPECILLTKEDNGEVVEAGDELGEDLEEVETVQLEARWIANQIKQLVEDKYMIYDKGLKCNRPLQYRDCVILLRSMPWASQMIEEFKQVGVPLYAELNDGYLDSTEIGIMLNLLRIIDNPHQDIPLASVLRSPIYGFKDMELGIIRAEMKKGNFYDSLQWYMKNKPTTELGCRLQKCVEQLQLWREDAKKMTLSDFVWKLLRETGYYDFVAGLTGAKQRQANLQMLYERARQFEQTSFRGLYRFLRFIERLEERGEDLAAAKILTEQENVVRLMTIHKSKGLEFPVVFVAGLNRQFNMQDLNASYLVHREYGFGTKFINPTLRITYPTISYYAIKNVKKAEQIAEEMRVLYVALTRAKEKLYLVGTIKNPEQTFRTWKGMAQEEEWVLPDYARSSAKSYLDWIGPALIRHPNAITLIEDVFTPSSISSHAATFTMTLVGKNQLKNSEVTEEARHEQLEQISKGERIGDVSEQETVISTLFNWQYKHEVATISKAKQSVTELKRLSQKQEETSETVIQRKILARPSFMEKRGLTAAERGTAIHVFMQHVDLRYALTRESVEEKRAELVNRELLTEIESESIPVEALLQFSESELGERIRRATSIHKELQFTLMIDGGGIEQELTNEEVFIQGIMDCVLEEEDHLVLIDYKTDSMHELKFLEKEEREDILRTRYQTQLSLYKQALERILKKPVRKSILYFFEGNQIIHIE